MPIPSHSLVRKHTLTNQPNSIFTFFGLFLEVFGLWGAKRGSSSATNGREKNGGAASAGATHQHNGDGAAATGTV